MDSYQKLIHIKHKIHGWGPYGHSIYLHHCHFKIIHFPHSVAHTLIISRRNLLKLGGGVSLDWILKCLVVLFLHNFTLLSEIKRKDVSCC